MVGIAYIIICTLHTRKVYLPPRCVFAQYFYDYATKRIYNMSSSPNTRYATGTQAIPAASRRSQDYPDGYSSTPGGTLYSTTPGGECKFIYLIFFVCVALKYCIFGNCAVKNQIFIFFLSAILLQVSYLLISGMCLYFKLCV